MQKTRYRINPYEPPQRIVADTEFRFGLIPATILGFVSVLAILYGVMVFPNVVRDARNGYGARYVIIMSMLPALFVSFGTVCAAASWLFAAGSWRVAMKTSILLLPIFAAIFIFAKVIP